MWFKVTWSLVEQGTDLPCRLQGTPTPMVMVEPHWHGGAEGWVRVATWHPMLLMAPESCSSSLQPQRLLPLATGNETGKEASWGGVKLSVLERLGLLHAGDLAGRAAQQSS